MTGIPKVVHWVWLGPGTLPAEHRAWMQGWLDRHPGWRGRLWRDAEIPRLRNQIEYDRARTWAQKSDVLRYEILLDHGGVYLDTDMECVRNIEELLAGVPAFAAAENDDLLGNAVLGALPNHPWMHHVVTELPRAFQDHLLTLDQTGPAFLTAHTLGREDVAIFPSRTFYPHSSASLHGEAPVPDRAFAVHHWSKSWAAQEVELLEQRGQQLLEQHVPPTAPLVLAAGGIAVRPHGRTPWPFGGVGEVDWGCPRDDEHALAELQRHQSEGVEWFAVLPPARWWLRFYPGLFAALHEHADCVVEEQAGTLFHLPLPRRARGPTMPSCQREEVR